MTFADELRNRFKVKQKEWEKYKEQVREAKEREAKAREELSAMQVLLASETPKGAKDKQKSGLVPVATPIQAETNKAEVVRLLINSYGSTGLSPAQIRAEFEKSGLPMPTNYLYAILLRAKRSGAVIEKDGKYYAGEQKEKAAS